MDIWKTCIVPDTKDIPLCKRNFVVIVTISKCEVTRLSTKNVSDREFGCGLKYFPSC